VSILPTFYEQYFSLESFTNSFFVLKKIRFVLCCRKNIGAKTVHKILVLLPPACPAPCMQRTYTTEMVEFHENSFAYIDPTNSQGNISKY
jgi:hypothetical protein